VNAYAPSDRQRESLSARTAYDRKRPCRRALILRAPLRARERVFLRRIREYASEVSPRIHFTGGIVGWLAARKQLSENVRILSVIESERKLRKVERQIFRAHFVE
jgi:hypothetical protein